MVAIIDVRRNRSWFGQTCRSATEGAGSDSRPFCDRQMPIDQCVGAGAELDVMSAAGPAVVAGAAGAPLGLAAAAFAGCGAKPS